MSQGGEICFFDGVWAFSSIPAIARPNAWCATCAGKQTANWALGRAGHKTLPREQKRSCRLMFRMVVSQCLTVYIPFISICSIFAYVCTPSSYSIRGQSRITLYCHTVPPPLRASRSTSSHNFSIWFWAADPGDSHPFPIVPDIASNLILPYSLIHSDPFNAIWCQDVPSISASIEEGELHLVFCSFDWPNGLCQRHTVDLKTQNKPKRQDMAGLEA